MPHTPSSADMQRAAVKRTTSTLPEKATPSGMYFREDGSQVYVGSAAFLLPALRGGPILGADGVTYYVLTQADINASGQAVANRIAALRDDMWTGRASEATRQAIAARDEMWRNALAIEAAKPAKATKKTVLRNQGGLITEIVETPVP